MPPLPEAFAHVSTDPAAEALYVPLPFGQLVVIPPPFNVALPLLTQLLTGLALSRVPEFVYPFLETLDRNGFLDIRCYSFRADFSAAAIVRSGSTSINGASSSATAP